MVCKSVLKAKCDTWLSYIRRFENQPGVPLLFVMSPLPTEKSLYYSAPVLPLSPAAALLTSTVYRCILPPVTVLYCLGLPDLTVHKVSEAALLNLFLSSEISILKLLVLHWCGKTCFQLYCAYMSVTMRPLRGFVNGWQIVLVVLCFILDKHCSPIIINVGHNKCTSSAQYRFPQDNI